MQNKLLSAHQDGYSLAEQKAGEGREVCLLVLLFILSVNRGILSTQFLCVMHLYGKKKVVEKFVGKKFCSVQKHFIK